MSVAALDGVEGAAVSRARWRLAGLAVVLTLAGLTLLTALALSARDIADRADDLGPGTVFVLFVVGALLVALMVPVSLVAGAAGYALGTVGGTPVALAAATVGAVLCAFVGRVVGTPAARYALGDRVARAVTWFDARPVRSVVIARLVPGLPFNATSYVFGFSRIGLREVAVGTALGFAPRCFAYVGLGGGVRDLSSFEARVALVVSVVVAVLVVVVPRLVVSDGLPLEKERHGHG